VFFDFIYQDKTSNKP